MRDASVRGSALLLGLTGYGLSMAMMVRAGLGLDPWDVFHQGLACETGMTIGIASAVVGVAVLLAWIPLRNRPGIGTVANVIVIAVTVDAGLAILPTPTSLAGACRDDGGRGRAQRDQHGALHRRGPRARPARRADDRAGASGPACRSGWSARPSRPWCWPSDGCSAGPSASAPLLYAFGIGPLVQLFVRITPQRVLAHSGWAAVAVAAIGRETSLGNEITPKSPHYDEQVPDSGSDSVDPDLLIDFARVTLRRGGQILVGPVTWSVELDERWVVIGPNGAGKTSLLRIAAAMEHPSSGTAYVLGERLGRTDMSELRSRVGLSSSALSQRVPEGEVGARPRRVGRIRRARPLAGDATRTSTTNRPSTCWRASAPNTWPSAPTRRCRKVSASGC